MSFRATAELASSSPGAARRATWYWATIIGTDFYGSKAVGNRAGVGISGAPDNAILANLISGNNGAGLAISGERCDRQPGSGQLIGTDTSGTKALGNQLSGVFIFSGASNNTIGGTTPGARQCHLGEWAVWRPDRLHREPGARQLHRHRRKRHRPLTTRAAAWTSARLRTTRSAGRRPRRRNVIAGNAGDGITIVEHRCNRQLGGGTTTSAPTNSMRHQNMPNFDNGVNILDASSNTIGGTRRPTARRKRHLGQRGRWRLHRHAGTRRATWSRATTSAPTSAGPRPWQRLRRRRHRRGFEQHDRRDRPPGHETSSRATNRAETAS